MPYDPPPDLAALTLSEIAEWVAVRKLPPVATWTPAREGESHMQILGDGRWLHEGSEIRRPAMARAFASLLMRDDAGQHWLVTPQERLRIAVDDAAFVATDVKREGDALVFRLNTDEFVLAGAEHPLVARGTAEAPAVYLAARNGCEARLNRSTWAQLAEIALAEAEAGGGDKNAGAEAGGDKKNAEAAEADVDALTVSSGGVTFALTPDGG